MRILENLTRVQELSSLDDPQNTESLPGSDQQNYIADLERRLRAVNKLVWSLKKDLTVLMCGSAADQDRFITELDNLLAGMSSDQVTGYLYQFFTPDILRGLDSDNPQLGAKVRKYLIDYCKSHELPILYSDWKQKGGDTDE